MSFGVSDILTHIGVRLYVLHLVVIHDAEITVDECLSHRAGQFSLGLDDLGACLLGLGTHFLLESNSHSATLLRLGLRDILIGLGLVNLKGCADVLAYVNVSDID